MNSKVLGLLGLFAMSAAYAEEKKAAEAPPAKAEEKKDTMAAPAPETADAGTPAAAKTPAKKGDAKKAK